MVVFFYFYVIRIKDGLGEVYRYDIIFFRVLLVGRDIVIIFYVNRISKRFNWGWFIVKGLVYYYYG